MTRAYLTSTHVICRSPTFLVFSTVQVSVFHLHTKACRGVVLDFRDRGDEVLTTVYMILLSRGWYLPKKTSVIDDEPRLTPIHLTARNVPPAAAPKVAGSSIVFISSRCKEVWRVADFPFFALLFPFPFCDGIELPIGNA